MLFLTSGVDNAQVDADECKDHPIFNRMPNYYLYSCEELEFSSMKFPVGKPDPNNKTLNTETVEGKIMVFTYSLKDEAKPSSGLQIMRNFQTASKQNGGITLGEYQGWCSAEYTYNGDINSGEIPIGNGCTNWSTTFKFTKDDKEYWVYQQYSDEGYDLIVAEKEAMKQDIQANEMFDKINTEEALILHINFETGKSAIKAESGEIVNDLYQMLKENPDLKIIVEGHTDNVGNSA